VFHECRLTRSCILLYQVLATHRILSAPVVSSEGNAAGAEHPKHAGPHDSVMSIVGFIDVRDILASFLQEVDLAMLKDAKMLKRMRILEDQGTRFAGKPIHDLKALGADGWFYALRSAQHASLRDIVYDGFLYPKETKALFGGSRSRQVVHRLALFNTDGRLTNVVSQSDVVTFIYQHLEDLGKLGDATVTDLGFVRGHAGVLTVRPETPALDAMVLMEERNISAVAVVNASGSIIGNFSISELRTIMAEHFGSLALPVGEFLALEHGTEYAGYAVQKDTDREESAPVVEAQPGSSPKPSSASFKFAQNRSQRRRESHPGAEVGQTLITCGPDTTLSEVLDKLVHNRLHRVSFRQLAFGKFVLACTHSCLHADDSASCLIRAGIRLR
jgi:5'-AMP-activated protein kinase, regulatory gamma subunit